MPRFKNKQSGSVVNVSEVDAEHLGPEYEPAKAADEKPSRRRASATD
jgi:hypothetical protein